MIKKNRTKKIFKRIGKVGVAVVSFSCLLTSRVNAVDTIESTTQVLTSKTSTKILNSALKIAGAKPSLSVAAGITCGACAVSSSPTLCIACGILLAKTLG